MAVTTTSTNGNTTLKWEVQAVTDKMTKIFNRAGEYWYMHHFQQNDQDGNPILWDDLTNVQKRGVLNKAYKKQTKDAADAFHVSGSKDTAGETAETEAEEDHVIDEIT